MPTQPSVAGDPRRRLPVPPSAHPAAAPPTTLAAPAKPGRKPGRPKKTGIPGNPAPAGKPESPPARPAAPKRSGPDDKGPDEGRRLLIRGARHHNLKGIDVAIPLGRFVCVTGVSGSGKSTLVNDILLASASAELNKAEVDPGDFDRIDGLEHLDKVIDIDQSPIGRTPRSNPATYTKVFDLVRDLYASLPESRVRGYEVGRFSFNVAGGRCDACEGNGAERKDMEFLADVWITCPICAGRRFNRETLEIRYKGRTIADVLEMDVQTALDHFGNIPKIRAMLQTLHDVGLDYIRLGQSSTTLSGGEAQRIKLARELSKRSTGRTLYILDEPTTGLHFADIGRLLDVLHGFVDAGNSVVVIEHNLDVIKTADWIIDLGPEGGSRGGRIVVTGTPEQVAAHPRSHTGRALAAVLDPDAHHLHAGNGHAVASEPVPEAAFLEITGARQHNLKDVHVRIPRRATTVLTGLSGSGKTSLAFDTIYAEGQRRYVESLSSYARQFLGRLQRPAVESVSGLSPAISIEQKNTGHSPRSTVGTVTEIYDHLRVLFARIGEPFCTDCDGPVGSRTSDQIVDELLSGSVPGRTADAKVGAAAASAGARVMLLAPVETAGDRDWAALLADARKNGYLRARVDGRMVELTEGFDLQRGVRHQVELLVDRVVLRPESRARIAEAVEQALLLGGGRLVVVPAEPAGDAPARDGSADRKAADTKSAGDKGPTPVERRFNQRHSCRACGKAHEELTPHHFSFNAALGWCPTCDGLGVQEGANPAELIADPESGILDGAIAGWSFKNTRMGRNPMTGEAILIPAPGGEPDLAEVVNAVCNHARIPALRPWKKLTPAQQAVILHGTGDAWIQVRPGLKMRFLGLYPGTARAAKLNWQMRQSLEHVIREVECSACRGGRIRPDAAAVRIAGRSIVDVCRMPLGETLAFLQGIVPTEEQRPVVGEVLREVCSRLRFLVDVGLDYLSLHRAAPTLSGGESRRIQLAGRLGSGLTGVLYVMDEPTVGLHPRDTRRLVEAVARLRDLGNTVLMVEHDPEVIATSDHVVDLGPGAGRHGGRIVAQGSPAALAAYAKSLPEPSSTTARTDPVAPARPDSVAAPPGAAAGSAAAGPQSPSGQPAPQPGTAPESATGLPPEGSPAAPDLPSVSLTARQLAGLGLIPVPTVRRPGNGKTVELLGVTHHNLRNVDVAIPLGTLTVVTGVSGSGKSSLVGDVLQPALARTLHRTGTSPGAHRELRGADAIDKVIEVDQSPLSAMPTANAATYTGAFDLIRTVFARSPEAKQRGLHAELFSFNRPGGRCEACEGAGRRKIEMHFLADVWVECEACNGTRYTARMLEVRHRGKNVAEVLACTVDQAAALFADHPALSRTLKMLSDVGLGYLALGQPVDTLSGGESQRVRLAAELSRPQTGRTFYVLDEPTTGLHGEDVRKLLSVLQRLTDMGNTVLVVEHNLDVIKSADHLIDMGPEPGANGGRVVAAGTPEDVARSTESRTAPFLRAVLERSPRAEPEWSVKARAEAGKPGAKPAKAGKPDLKGTTKRGRGADNDRLFDDLFTEAADLMEAADELPDARFSDEMDEGSRMGSRPKPPAGNAPPLRTRAVKDVGPPGAPPMGPVALTLGRLITAMAESPGEFLPAGGKRRAGRRGGSGAADPFTGVFNNLDDMFEFVFHADALLRDRKTDIVTRENLADTMLQAIGIAVRVMPAGAGREALGGMPAENPATVVGPGSLRPALRPDDPALGRSKGGDAAPATPQRPALRLVGADESEESGADASAAPEPAPPAAAKRSANPAPAAPAAPPAAKPAPSPAPSVTTSAPPSPTPEGDASEAALPARFAHIESGLSDLEELTDELVAQIASVVESPIPQREKAGPVHIGLPGSSGRSGRQIKLRPAGNFVAVELGFPGTAIEPWVEEAARPLLGEIPNSSRRVAGKAVLTLFIAKPAALRHPVVRRVLFRSVVVWCDGDMKARAKRAGAGKEGGR